MEGYTLRRTERTALRLPRHELVAAADREGAITISAQRLARLAGCSKRTTWSWLNGIAVSPEIDAAIIAALKLNRAAWPPRSKGGKHAGRSDHVRA